MQNIVQKIPFLRLTIALAIGIIIGSCFNFPSILLILLICFTLISLILLHRFYKFRFVNWFGFSTHLLFILIGILIFEGYNRKPEFFENGIFIATVLEKTQEKKNSYKTIIKISSVRVADTILQTNEKVLVYFEKSEKAINLDPGDNIVFKTNPQIIKNYGNPFEFDYKKFLSNKKIYRQVYLSNELWEETNHSSRFSLIVFAEIVREKLLTIYRKQPLGKNELEILSALTLGYKRGLDPETKRIFSSAGAMHVLAVSGLHVGIIYWVITILIGFLRKNKKGRFLFVIISIILLWCYAFISGLPPSVIRASTMFTIYIIGDNLNRKANTYNSLAASGLFLLLLNPNNIFEVSFQLSYSAVFGIVFLQPKISKLLPVKNKIIKFFWILLTVSIAAQITTFPLTTYYFNQFPTYFWITNLIIIPAVMILIPSGMALLVFSKIPIISNILTITLNSIIKASYFVLSKIEQLPFSTQEISLQQIELVFLIGILFSIFLLFQKLNAQRFKALLSFILCFVTTSLVSNYNSLESQNLIVYNTSQNTTMQLISGKNNFVISDHKIENDENILSLIQKTNRELKLDAPLFLTHKDTIVSPYLYLENGFIFFEDKFIIFNTHISNVPETISLDYFVNSNSYNNLDFQLLENTSLITNKRYFQTEFADSNQFHITSRQGAFIEKW